MNTKAADVAVGEAITLVVNGMSTGTVDVTAATPKALRVHNREGRASTWIPRSVLSLDPKYTVEAGGSRFLGMTIAPWFVRKLWAGSDPRARVALGLSCW